MSQDTLVVFPDLRRAPAGGGREVVYDALSERQRLLTAPEAAALSACAGAGSLEEHVAAVRAAHPSVPVDEVERTVRALLDHGLLLSAAGLYRRLVEGVETRRPAQTRMLGIPTAGRARDLALCVQSFAEGAAAAGRPLEIVVADGGPGDAALRLLEALPPLPSVEVRYSGLAERASYAAALAARAGVPVDLVLFALVPGGEHTNGTGSNRNTLLLEGAGECFLSVDDDTRCRFARAPGLARPPSDAPFDALRGGLVFTSAYDPTEHWFDLPEASPIPEHLQARVDVFSLHEALLGATAADLALRAARERVSFRRVHESFFRRLGSSRGRVLSTQIGNAGDTGTGSMLHYLLLGGASRARLVASEAVYRRAFEERRSLRCAPVATVSEAPFFMSMCVGLDARGMLPPFMPVERNADGLFATLVRACLGDALFGLVPAAVEHRPPVARRTNLELELARATDNPANDLACGLVASRRLVPGPAEDMLRELGAELRELGGLDPRALESIVRPVVTRGLAGRVAQVEKALAASSGGPAFWADDLRRTLAVVAPKITEPRDVAPSDLAARAGSEGAWALFSRMLGRLGELCERWPALFDAARDLRREGVRPSVRIRTSP